MKKQYNIKFMLLCIVIVLAFFNIFLFLNKNNQQASNSLLASPTITPPPEENLLRWKNYTNQKHLYSLRYPNELLIEENDQNSDRPYQVLFGLPNGNDLLPIMTTYVFSGSENEFKDYISKEDTVDKQLFTYTLSTPKQSQGENTFSLLILTLFSENIKNNNLNITSIIKEVKSSLDLSALTRTSN